MKTPEIAKLIKRFIEPEFPGYTRKVRLYYKVPLTNILRGYYFDSGRWSADELYVFAFVQPLYVRGTTWSST